MGPSISRIAILLSPKPWVPGCLSARDPAYPPLRFLAANGYCPAW